MSQNLCGRRQFDNSTPLKHAPLTFPAHCPGYPRNSMCSGGEGRTIQLRPDAKGARTTALRGSHHAIAAKEATRGWPDRPAASGQLVPSYPLLDPWPEVEFLGQRVPASGGS
jgi:hypothetical protein